MDRYALVESGTVVNVIAWDGVAFNEEEGTGWSPPEGIIAIRVEEGEIPNIGLGYVDGVYEQASPGAVVIPPPTPEDIFAINTATKKTLLANASAQIAPLQDAVDFGEATPEEEVLLTKWKQYRVAVNRIVLTLPNPDWPPQP